MTAPTVSLACAVEFTRDADGEPYACMGVDVQAPRPAPVGKRFGVDVGAHDDLPLASQLLLLALGFRPPYVESNGQAVAIGHDPADCVVILGPVPGHAGGAEGCHE